MTKEEGKEKQIHRVMCLECGGSEYTYQKDDNLYKHICKHIVVTGS